MISMNFAPVYYIFFDYVQQKKKDEEKKHR